MKARQLATEDQVPAATDLEPSPNDTIRRAIFAGLGLLFVVIAAVGVFLPLIPTVGPLLLASLFLTKSNPAWERKLVRNKLFAKYLYLLDGKNSLSQRERLVSIALMWTSIVISGLVLYFTRATQIWLLVLLFLLGVVGTVFILRFGRRKPVKDSPSQRN